MDRIGEKAVPKDVDKTEENGMDKSYDLSQFKGKK
ncbi:Protein of unknown function [Bacillus cytotoxicus]|uniref:Uncharacterized protein n=1 Tax=Bacillus cytotoxicus TaxID=580165 RepID=A0AAX2CDE9_9BACI|nr:Protein of unknown function [Bacillus cytotoxicus]SCN32258.1 Protein of unknown function [Bacillus cytotoxicus]